MELIRKTVLHVETTYVDGGKEAAKPLKMVAAAAVIKKSVGRARLCRKPNTGNSSHCADLKRAFNQAYS